ncbi:MAG TPA: ATP synthase F1 subunit epsilon [Haliangiales bacterium]|nr:ATP synthase F1 subunit epsilon [Haliangiales bacterium]
MGPEAHAESEVVGSHAHLPVVGRLAVSVVTPVGRLLAHAADEVVAPGADGEFGVLTGHVPFLAALRPGVLLVRDDKERKILAVGSGYLQVDAGGRTQILVERAAWPADIDVEEARAEKAKLEAEIKELGARAEASAVASLGARLAWAQARIDAAAAK